MNELKYTFKKGETAAKYSSLVVIALGITKGIIGFFSGSVALIAQAVDSLTDLVSILVVYTGLKLAQKEPTEKFPYGYYRAETFASLLVSLFIIGSGLVILYESIMRFIHPQPLSYPLLAMMAAAFSIPFLYLISQYNRKTGEELNSQALLGESKNFMFDIYSSVLVFVGIAALYFGFPWVEPLVGIIISMLILKAGFEIGRDAILTLMDAVITPEHLNKIKEIAENVPGVIGVHDIKIRKSGPLCFGEMHMEVQEDLHVDTAHTISEEVELKAKRACEGLERLNIHIEPGQQMQKTIIIPVKTDNGLDSQIADHFAEAPYFFFAHIEKDTMISWNIKSNPGAQLEKKKGIKAAEFLRDERVYALIVGHIGKAPYHILRDSIIWMYAIDNQTNIQDLITAFLEKKLRKILPP